MKRFVAIALVLALGACGDSTGPAMGTVKFTRDGNTCNGSPLAFTFFSDGSTLGTETLAAGSSKSYLVAAGSHIFSVQVANSTYRFNPLTASVPEGQTFTYLMLCS